MISIDVINNITILELNGQDNSPVSYTAPQTVILSNFYDDSEISSATSLQTFITNGDVNLFVNGVQTLNLEDAGNSAVQTVNTEIGNVVIDAADVGADPDGTAALEVLNHESKADPHSQYTTETEASNAAPIQTITGNIVNNTDTKNPIINFTEVDPVFSASEASSFTPGDKVNLDNQSGVNTGDQNASSVPFTPTGNTTSNNVQSAIEEIQSDIDGISLDHGSLTGLSDDDHPQYLNETRHDSLPNDNPHNVNKTQVGLSNVPNINATERSNHTGTQSASTILDFDTEVSNNPDVIINTNKVSADGSINTHSDVDTTTNTPLIGDTLSFDGSNWIPQNTTNGYTIFAIWAEENGALSNNNRQWSFGNGSTGAVNITIPIDCEIFAMSLEAEVGGTSVSIELMQNNSPVISNLFNGINDFTILNSTIPVTAGDIIGFRTDIETGSYTDVRVSAWFRVRSSPASTSVLNDLLDVSIDSITSNQILQFNGSNFIPLTLDNNAVGLGNVDNTSDIDKPISIATQSALDQKLESSDIINFETSSQLDIRDTSNRDRSNHTGTQTASTISDFTTAVQSAQYAGSLSLSANVLSFNDGNGNITSLDLSIYLDDTNLARITGGTLNSTTGIATFTRDDSSTFDVDFSSLNDQAFITQAITDHENEVDPHSQYQTSTEVQAQIEVHSLNTNNPHNTDISQIGSDSLKLFNTGVTGNLNSGISILSALDGTDTLGSGTSFFSAVTNGIQCNFNGSVVIHFNIELSGTVTRAVLGFRWFNSTQNTFGPWARNTYIRNASGHTESSANFSTEIQVNNGDVIQIQHEDFAAAGTVISPANGIEFILRRTR